MGSRKGRFGKSLAVFCACFTLSFPVPALAQDSGVPSAGPPSAPIDLGGPTVEPDAPMSEMPGIGVDWPEIAPDTSVPATSTTTAKSASDPRYEYQITGIDLLANPKIMERFRGLSVLRDGDGKAENFAQIDRRTKADSNLLIQIMRSEGYYDAVVDTEIETKPDGSLAISLVVTPGERYTFDEVNLPGIERAAPVEQQVRDSFGVKSGDPVVAENVLVGVQNVRTTLGQTGFPFAKVGDPDVTVDHRSMDADMTVAIDPGGRRTIGRVILESDELFGVEHITDDIARFKTGDIYDEREIEDLRRALIATGLVASARVRPVPGATEGTADIEIKLTPGKLRTIAGEIGYGTGEGFRAEVSWQHRNLVKPEGGFTARAVAGTQEQLLSTTLRFNNWHRRDQVLTFQAAASNLNRSAYDAKTFQLSGTLERQTNFIFQKKWTYSFGVELIATDERDTYGPNADPRRRTFFIGALPASLYYDGTDNFLDPQSGFRLGGRISPEVSLQGNVFSYVRLQLDASGYYPAMDNLVIAGRVRVGSILGSDSDRIAPSRRFYAGGGGSVRGYGYQDIGPRDLNNDPIGGSSLTEFSLEARYRMGNIGIVPFIDAGNIGTGALPGIDDLRFGAGLGFRYYSNFGPIRIDIGTPLNRQPGDPRIAVYVSLGQAF